MSWNNVIPASLLLGPIKQVIVVRKDLNMRKGKIAAQAAHASSNVFLNRLEWKRRDVWQIKLQPHEVAWLDGSSRRTKICVYVNSEEELKAIHKKAVAAGLLAELVLDAGLTEFKEPTLTCCAIGPAPASEIDKITGSLPLY